MPSLTPHDMELALRLLISMLFGVLIGIERQWHHKNAGLKTNTLVAVGATAFAMMSAAGFGPNNNPAQVAAGVVTGIGFIGGGVIMRRGSSVQGINTAATLWATASMGLAIGIGYYKLGCFILVAVLSSQFFLRWGARIIDNRSGMVLPSVLY
ncbi:MAG: MgtC/SapB family protein, partial [Blastocatellia bacterium]